MASEEKNRRRRNTEPTMNIKFVRVVRTASSEAYVLWQEDTRLGQVDIHLGEDLIYATLILEKDLKHSAQTEIVQLLDQDIVSSHLAQFDRENFLVTVWRGVELDSFSDGEPDIIVGNEDGDFDDDDDEEEEY